MVSATSRNETTTDAAEVASDEPRREKAMIPEHATDDFSLSNPMADPDYYSVPKLLRRLADHPDEFGDDTVVRDLRLEWSKYRDLETNECNEQLGPSIIVYCSRRDAMSAANANMNYFSMMKPEGESGRGSVPKLLRRVADRLEKLGDDAVVFSMITHTEPTGEGFAPSVNTYYTREEGWVRNFDPQTHELLLEWERDADSHTHETDEE
jgi:hypothetical protein